MHLGLALPAYATDGWRIPASRFLQLADQAEEIGFDGVWLTEHLLTPPTREYSRFDPLSTLSTLAGSTESIPLGTSILIAPLRNPILLAQRIATLQHLSQERLILGLGIGWVEEEYNAVGVPFEERGRRFTEGLELLHRLFDGDEVTFEGDYYSADGIRLEPPVRRRPKLLIGGGGIEKAGSRMVPQPILNRILEYGDGWLASSAPLDTIERDWKEIERHLSENGRNPSVLQKNALNWLHLVPGADSERAREKQRATYRSKEGRDVDRIDSYLQGSVEEIRSELHAYREAGYDRLIVGPTTSDPNEVEKQIELYAEEFDEFLL